MKVADLFAKVNFDVEFGGDLEKLAELVSQRVVDKLLEQDKEAITFLTSEERSEAERVWVVQWPVWLITLPMLDGSTCYWAGEGELTPDPNSAVRFVREEDALQVIGSITDCASCDGYGVIEYLFGAP